MAGFFCHPVNPGQVPCCFISGVYSCNNRCDIAEKPIACSTSLKNILTAVPCALTSSISSFFSGGFVQKNQPAEYCPYLTAFYLLPAYPAFFRSVRMAYAVPFVVSSSTVSVWNALFAALPVKYVMLPVFLTNEVRVSCQLPPGYCSQWQMQTGHELHRGMPY